MTPPNPASPPALKRGEVVLVLYPNSNLASAKFRPALVVQADQLNTGLRQVILAMISSNVSRAGHPSRVLVPIASLEGRRAGLLTDSVVMADNLATVTESAVSRVIGFLPMVPVEVALRHTLGL